MADYDDFEFEDNVDDFDDDGVSEGGNDNRTFWLVAGGLGIILILALVCMVVYAMVFMPQRRDAQSTQAAAIQATNEQVSMDAEMTAQAQAWTQTPTITLTQAPNTATPTRTPVLAATDTPAGAQPTADPRTATVSALLTQQAGGGSVTPTPTQLPDTGFADDIGLPGMVALAAALVVVIFLARRLRNAG